MPPKKGKEKAPADEATVAGKTAPAPMEQMPEWASQMTKMLQLMATRLDKVEKKTDWSEDYPQLPIGQPGPVVQWPQMAPMPYIRQPAKAAEPKMGEQGSGYTRLPNGKTVKNRRPKTRSLPERQALNWRTKATEALIAFRKEHNLTKGEDCPAELQEVQDPLVLDLTRSKAYEAYVHGGGEQKVHEWRQANSAL
jgi:hypothetical protein